MSSNATRQMNAVDAFAFPAVVIVTLVLPQADNADGENAS
jgi:hypothetical protein